jgi:ATP-dependent helicase HrpB
LPALDNKLPIHEVLPELLEAFGSQTKLVLQAPPGAGKTTIVPLAILQQQQNSTENWLQNQRILVLEPRRMAARSVARRMANLLGEAVGHQVGYRVRQDSQVSQHTRIEVITEGILLRRLLRDPALEGVGLIIFDEFHERSMDMDTGLALALQCNELFRDAAQPLRILVMSATLDGQAISSLLQQAPLITSSGRTFPVTTHYGQPYRQQDNLVQRVCQTIGEALTQHDGSVLVFLPGQGEINRVKNQLVQLLTAEQQQNTLILPLYGALPYDQQQLAIEPLAVASAHASDTGRWTRKVVLATDIAETSLTIEGITIVIDGGLHRAACFDAGTGMTRLTTRRISKDSAEQRQGRAGRTSAGHCYRLWSEEQQHRLAQRSTAEILQADLAPLALQLLAWGIDHIDELSWLDKPPAAMLAQALDLLKQLGAIKPRQGRDSKENSAQALDTSAANSTESYHLVNWQLTAHGQQMSTMPSHPRLAHMLICSKSYQLEPTAALLAALLSERNPLSYHYGADLTEQLQRLNNDRSLPASLRGNIKAMKQQAKTFARTINAVSINSSDITEPSGAVELDEHHSIAYLIACAYPDRIARRKAASHHHYVLSNGRQATLAEDDPLCRFEWLAVAELTSSGYRQDAVRMDRIVAAAGFTEELLSSHLQPLISINEVCEWQQQADRFVAEQRSYIGKLVISTTALPQIPLAAKNQALLVLIHSKGLSLLPWQAADRQWQARVMLLHNLQQQSGQKVADAERWPDVSDQHLLTTLADWLLPYLDSVVKLGDFKRLSMATILGSLLPWSLSQQLNTLAPVAIEVPSGSTLKIDYLAAPPILKVKLQEMFGCQTTPTIANGAVQLMVHLLSPAQRPLQITQDLAGFWQSSYFEVQKEMKGRYPKHAWPDNPLLAPATKYSKRRRS